jgi:hypothetical protein
VNVSQPPAYTHVRHEPHGSVLAARKGQQVVGCGR